MLMLMLDTTMSFLFLNNNKSFFIRSILHFITIIITITITITCTANCFIIIFILHARKQRLGKGTWGNKCTCADQGNALGFGSNKMNKVTSVRWPKPTDIWLDDCVIVDSTLSERAAFQLQECHGGLCRASSAQGYPAQGQVGAKI